MAAAAAVGGGPPRGMSMMEEMAWQRQNKADGGDGVGGLW